MKKLGIFIIVIGLLYTGAWFGSAHLIKQYIASGQLKDITFSPALSDITGFPFFPKLSYTGTIKTPTFSITATDMMVTPTANFNQASVYIDFPKGFSLQYRSAKVQKFNASHVKVTAPYPLPEGNSQAHIQAWQNKNGHILVSDMLLKKDGVKIVGKQGKFGLDQELQITGKMDTSIYGYQVLMAQIGQTGLINKKHMGLANAFLGQVLGGGTQATNKQEKAFNTPIIIKDRRVRVGPMTVAKLNKLKWTE